MKEPFCPYWKKCPYYKSDLDVCVCGTLDMTYCGQYEKFKKGER